MTIQRADRSNSAANAARCSMMFENLFCIAQALRGWRPEATTVRSALLAGSAICTVSAAAIVGTPTIAQAACTALGGNRFEITAGGTLNLDFNCTGATDGAVATVTGNQTNQLLDSAGNPENWTVIIKPGVALSSTSSVAPVFSADANFTLTNDGEIHGADSAAVQVDGVGTTTSATITNRGVIDSLTNFSAGDLSSALLIRAPSSSRVVNESTGRIIGRGRGITFAAEAIVVNAGTITGQGGTAIQFATAGSADILELQPGSMITGNVLAAGGTDTLRFAGIGTGSFDFSTVGAAAQYRDFETFEVTGGTWQFTGALASPINVTGPGVLAGTATVGVLTVNAGGTIAPGNPVGSIGTLTTTDPVTFGANSVFQVNVNAAGQSDLLEIGGTVDINTTGTLLDIQAIPGAYNLSQTFRIMRSAGQLTGRFATVQDSLPDVDFQPIYADDGITLGLIAGTGPQSPKGVLPSSLMAAVHSDRLFNQTLRRRGGLMVSDLGMEAGSGFGSAIMGFYPGQAPERLPQYALAADLPAQQSAPFAMPARAPQAARDWAVWGAMMGRSAQTDSTGALAGWDARIGGMAFGAERRFAFEAAPVLVGLSGGFTRSDVDVQGSGSDIDGYHVGAYAASDLGALSLSGAVSYAWQDYDLSRLIPVGGGFVTASGSADGHSLTGSAEAFYDVIEGLGFAISDSSDGRDVAFGPLVTLESEWADRNGFTETGAGILNLTVADQSIQQTVTGLGLAAQTELTLGRTQVLFEGRLAWEHVFGDRNAVSSSAIPLAAATFVTASAPISRDRIALGLGSAIAVSDSLSVHLRYDGSFSDSTHDHQGSAGLTVRF